MYFPALQTVFPSESALVVNISAATISTTSKTSAYIISTMYMDISLMSSLPKPTGDDFGIEDELNIDEGSSLMSLSPKLTGIDFDIEDEPDIDEGSGNDSILNYLLLTSTVTLGGKCMNF